MALLVVGAHGVRSAYRDIGGGLEALDRDIRLRELY